MAHSSLVMEATSGTTAYDDVIYEEGYPTDWDTENGIPTAYMETHERLRLVDITESNLYNIT